MIRVHVWGEGDRQLGVGGEELLDAPGQKWIDVEAPDAAEMQRLAARFHLHRLVVEDCLHLDQRPKIEEYPEHLFIVLQGFSQAGADVCNLTLHELHFVLGAGYLITVHAVPAQATRAARARIESELSLVSGRGPDFVAYLIADELVDQNYPLLDHFNEELEELEMAIFRRPDQRQLQRLFDLKRMLLELRRVLSPQRDIVGQLSRRGAAQVDDRTSVYFRDVYDHLLRLYEQIDAGRDILGNTMEGYLSMVANRTSEITKHLTVIATIFLPLSFITGFFGQNFERLARPELFWLMIGAVLAVPAVLYAWFRHRHWA